ncbi:hypothetical protein WJX72_000726 [[Myrmecia] bisecta]|uniref:DUF4234 domain-containing protein n=1 Tax=[Myrmecia] bisecta TaxID=41462 RepID=A0AAW1PTS0_9CHLO
MRQGSTSRVPDTLLDVAAYNPAGGSELVKNVFGFLYVVVVAVFVVRLFRRRAQRATSERIAAKAEQEARSIGEEGADKEATPLAAAWGAAQAAFFTYLLFQLSTNVDAYFGRQQLPDQFTARNITVTLRTVIQGLSYLATFIFAANAVGLTGLTLQLLLSPPQKSAAPLAADSESEQEEP